MPVANFLATEVNPSGLTALIRNLGRDCHPTQFLREFTKNAIEACQRTGEKDRSVTVDFNEDLYSKLGIHKISFTDNGDGMTADQMINLLNNLSASGDTKNEFQNYGVGAKISALTRNHCGIQYESWKDGIGHTIMIKYNPNEAIYGIEGVTQDGLSHYAIQLGDGSKPRDITTHGTRVTLWGMEDQQDTMLPPDGVAGGRESWIALYLNSRFFRIPVGVGMKARIGYFRENNPRHNYLSTILGQKAILDEKAQIKGELKLSDAKLYWWVMPKGIDGHGRELVKGHTALINENEIFDIGDARSSRSAYFGIIVGRDRVIIYVEPSNVVQNTSRTNLLRPDGSPVVWDKWQDEFRSSMPGDLKEFLDDLQSESANESHTDSIKERLKAIKDLYKLSRYKPNSEGKIFADPDSISNSDTGHIRIGEPNGGSRATNASKPGLKQGSLSTALLTALVEQNAGAKVVGIEPDPFPTVQWVSVGKDENEQLLDRAAEYIPTSNLIMANKNFQGFSDVIKFFSKTYADVPEVIKIIEDEVRQAFEQALTECVAGALSLKNRSHWNPNDFNAAISREALTTAVMQRYWLISHVKRVLGSKIKGFNEATTAA